MRYHTIMRTSEYREVLAKIDSEFKRTRNLSEARRRYSEMVTLMVAGYNAAIVSVRRVIVNNDFIALQPKKVARG